MRTEFSNFPQNFFLPEGGGEATKFAEIQRELVLKCFGPFSCLPTCQRRLTMSTKWMITEKNWYSKSALTKIKQNEGNVL